MVSNLVDKNKPITFEEYVDFLNNNMQGKGDFKKIPLLERDSESETFIKNNRAAVQYVQKALDDLNDDEWDSEWDGTAEDAAKSLRELFADNADPSLKGYVPYENKNSWDKGLQGKNLFCDGHLSAEWREIFNTFFKIAELAESDRILYEDYAHVHYAGMVDRVFSEKNQEHLEASVDKIKDLVPIMQKMIEYDNIRLANDTDTPDQSAMVLATSFLKEHKFNGIKNNFTISENPSDAAFGYAVTNWTETLQKFLNLPEVRTLTDNIIVPVNGKMNPQTQQAMTLLQEKYGDKLSDVLLSVAEQSYNFKYEIPTFNQEDSQRIAYYIPQIYSALTTNGQFKHNVQAAVQAEIDRAGELSTSEGVRKEGTERGFDLYRAQHTMRLTALIDLPQTDQPDDLSEIATIIGSKSTSPEDIAAAIVEEALWKQEMLLKVNSRIANPIIESIDISGDIDAETLKLIKDAAHQAASDNDTYSLSILFDNTSSRGLKIDELERLNELRQNLPDEQRINLEKAIRNRISTQTIDRLQGSDRIINSLRRVINKNIPDTQKLTSEVPQATSDNLSEQTELLMGLSALNTYLAQQIGEPNPNGIWNEDLQKKLNDACVTVDGEQLIILNDLQTVKLEDLENKIDSTGEEYNKNIIFGQWLNARLKPLQPEINARILAMSIGGEEYNAQLKDAHSAIEAIPVLKLKAAAVLASPEKHDLLKGQTFDISKEPADKIGLNTVKQLQTNEQAYSKWAQTELRRKGNIFEASLKAVNIQPSDISDEQIQAFTTLAALKTQKSQVLSEQEYILTLNEAVLDKDKFLFIPDEKGDFVLNAANIDFSKIDAKKINALLEEKSKLISNKSAIDAAKEKAQSAKPDVVKTSKSINAAQVSAFRKTLEGLDMATLAATLNNAGDGEGLDFTPPSGYSKTEYFKKVKALVNAKLAQDTAFTNQELSIDELTAEAANVQLQETKPESSAEEADPKTEKTEPDANKPDPAGKPTPPNPSKPGTPPAYLVPLAQEQEHRLKEAGITGKDAQDIINTINGANDYYFGVYEELIRKTEDLGAKEPAALLLNLWHVREEMKNDPSLADKLKKKFSSAASGAPDPADPATPTPPTAPTKAPEATPSAGR